jgi:hypothetical protein
MVIFILGRLTMSEHQTPDTSQIDAETEKELQEFLEVTETDVETLEPQKLPN